MSSQLSRHLVNNFQNIRPLQIFVKLGQKTISGDSDIYWILKGEEESDRKSERVDKKDLLSWRKVMTKEKSPYVRKYTRSCVSGENSQGSKTEEGWSFIEESVNQIKEGLVRKLGLFSPGNGEPLKVFKKQNGIVHCLPLTSPAVVWRTKFRRLRLKAGGPVKSSGRRWW